MNKNVAAKKELLRRNPLLTQQKENKLMNCYIQMRKGHKETSKFITE